MGDYYKLYTNERRIPGILVLIVVGLIFGIPFFFLNKQTNPKDALGKTERPVVVELLNQTATSADIYWKTEAPTVDTLIYWDTTGTKNTALDIHDIESNKTPRRLHFFSLKNLTAKTKYFLQINHNNSLFGSTDQPYSSFTTLANTAISTTLPPLYGKVVDTAGNPVSDVLLKVRVGAGQLMGAFTKSDGSFLISLCCLYNNETYEPYNPARSEIVKLHFENEFGIISRITAPISAVSPFQNAVRLGENSNLLVSVSPQPEEVLGVETDASVLAIYYPKDSAVIPGTRPLFKGSALPNTRVILSFPKETRSFEITSDASGVWEFVPKFNLKVGAQTVIVKSTDPQKKVISVARVFNIPKSGQDVLGEATGSGSLTPTTSLSPTAVPTDVIIVTPTVGVTSAPTAAPTLIPSGIAFEIFGLSGIALMLLGAGIILLF